MTRDARGQHRRAGTPTAAKALSACAFSLFLGLVAVDVGPITDDGDGAPSEDAATVAGASPNGQDNPEPGTATRSHYVSWMTGDEATDVRRSHRSGCRTARTGGGPVVLAFGRQVPGGTTGFTVDGAFHAYTHIETVSRAYAEGLRECSNATWTLIVTTSNNGLAQTDVARLFGRQWAETVQRISSTAASGTVSVAAGIDLEPSWGTYLAAQGWVDAYRQAGGPALVFNASADGCPETGSEGTCNNDWTVHALAATIWHRPGDQALPQIYRPDGAMARQWAVIARAGRELGYVPTFTGVMTQHRACGQVDDPECLRNTPEIGRRQLDTALHGIADVTQVTDIGWD